MLRKSRPRHKKKKSFLIYKKNVYVFQENSGLRRFWFVKYTQRKRKFKMANIVFGNPRHMSIMSIHYYRSQNVPFIGKVDPSQLTDYK